MTRIAASGHGETRLRLLRIVRRGQRDDPKDLTISWRFEGDFATSFTEGRPDGLVPGEAIKTLVHTTARSDGDGEIETLALALSERILAAYPRITRVKVEVSEQPWTRIPIGGRAEGQAFEAASPERRTAAVTSNGRQIAVVSGIEQLTLMRSSGLRAPRRHEDATGLDDRLPRLFAGALSAKWTYLSPDVTFGPYRQALRSMIVETFAVHGRLSIEHTLHDMAEVALASYPDIADITLTMQERPYRPVDPFSAGDELVDDLFVVVDAPLRVVELTLEREVRDGES
jgi:urate oxidase